MYKHTRKDEQSYHDGVKLLPSDDSSFLLCISARATQCS